MNLAVRSILGVLAVGLCAQFALANNNATATSSLSTQAPKKEGSMFSGFINASRSTSLVDHQDGTKEDAADYAARLNAVINEKYSFRLQAGYSQDLNYPEKNDFSDTVISFARAPVKLGAVGRYTLLGYRISATAPTSKDSYKRQSLQTALSTSLVWMVNPDRLKPGFEIAGGISLGKNFHQYDTALDGKVNNAYTSSQTLSISYEFNYGLSLSAEFVHKNAYSYQNNLKDSFEMSQELGFAFNPSFAVAIGHTNSGSTLRPNGSEYGADIIDENTSMVYGQFTALF